MATLEEKVSLLSKEELEKKFINLYNTHQSLIKKFDINENDLDFFYHETKRRQQYLHKNYSPHLKVYNGLLKILIEKENIHLQKFFNNLNKELEIKATEKEDFPRKEPKYK